MAGSSERLVLYIILYDLRTLTFCRSNLLEAVFDAHGGLDRFKRVREIHFTVNVSGVLWVGKGYKGHHLLSVVIDTQSAKVTFRNLLGDQDYETLWIWTPQRVWKELPNGSTIDSRDAPREAYKGHSVATPWDDFHLLYFRGYAIWNYALTPFFFTWPGFETRQVETHLKGEEANWRVLEVTFPKDVHTHCPVQRFYFDEKHILRRLDYNADVVAGTPTAHYLFDYRKVDGLLFPMLRRAVVNPTALLAGGPSAVLLDFYNVAVKHEDGSNTNKL